MEPILNIPVDLDAVSCSSWPVAATPESTEAASSLPPIASPCTVVVNLPERVTAREAKALLRDLKYELAVDQPIVVLDMSDVREMDSAGLDLVLMCAAETIRRDGSLQVRGISPQAAALLELTGLDRVLNLAPEKVATEFVSLPLRETRPQVDLSSVA